MPRWVRGWSWKAECVFDVDEDGGGDDTFLDAVVGGTL
jgi:hypothetical protein